MSPLSRSSFIFRIVMPALLLSFCTSCFSIACAEVNVTYVKPEQFTDMPALERDALLKDLSRHFAKLGTRLPPGQDLLIEVTDFHLSGWLKPTTRLPGEIRVLKGGADWPSMHLRYRLEANGQPLRSGEDDLSNMMYLQRINNYRDDDSLRYEKQMVDDWFAARFGAPPK